MVHTLLPLASIDMTVLYLIGISCKEQIMRFSIASYTGKVVKKIIYALILSVPT